VKRLYAQLTDAERGEYEKRCMAAPRYGANRRLYDDEKARIIGEILARRTPAQLMLGER